LKMEEKSWSGIIDKAIGDGVFTLDEVKVKVDEGVFGGKYWNWMARLDKVKGKVDEDVTDYPQRFRAMVDAPGSGGVNVYFDVMLATDFKRRKKMAKFGCRREHRQSAPSGETERPVRAYLASGDDRSYSDSDSAPMGDVVRYLRKVAKDIAGTVPTVEHLLQRAMDDSDDELCMVVDELRAAATEVLTATAEYSSNCLREAV